MELLILDIISLILRKVKINGYNLTTKELDNLIQEIFKLIVLEVKIGEDKVKVLIS